MPTQEERFAVIALDGIDAGQIQGLVPALKKLVMGLQRGEFVKHGPGSDSNRGWRLPRGLRRECELPGRGCRGGRALVSAGLRGKVRGCPGIRIPGESDGLRNSSGAPSDAPAAGYSRCTWFRFRWLRAGLGLVLLPGLRESRFRVR